MSTINKQPKATVAELLAKARARRDALLAEQAASTNQAPVPPMALTAITEAIIEELHGVSELLVPTQEPATSLQRDDVTTSVDKYGNTIEYNKEQAKFVEIATSKESCILIGAAGTGKTTTMRGVMEALITQVGIPVLASTHHKHLVDGTPGILCCAYTRRAVQNLKRAMSAEMQDNCITIHKLLEYQPTYYEVIDEKTGSLKNTMKFEPARSSFNPLPSSIHTIIIDEASMVSVELYNLLMDAISHGIQVIFLGDIQQLPPVFGEAILGFKLLELPVVELVQVYRQALESPIIRLAHRILSGNVIPVEEYAEWKYEGQLTLHPWKRKLDVLNATHTAAKFLQLHINEGKYDPDQDVVLIPHNKKDTFGAHDLNLHIGNFLARRDGRVTYEVLGSMGAKKYFSIGDKVLYEKEDAIITSISANGAYGGKDYQVASTTLDYWGHDQGSPVKKTTGMFSMDEGVELSADDIDSLMDSMANTTEDRGRQASHVITMVLQNSDEEISISIGAEISELEFGWVITVHKSQGSEWRKVYFIVHQSHATMTYRELLYTACTRAKEELYVICEPDTFTKGITSQRIKGETLAEKAAFFQNKRKGQVSKYKQTSMLEHLSLA